MGADSCDSVFSISRYRRSSDDDSAPLSKVSIIFFKKHIFFINI